jgi:hypothetical protein
MGTAFAGILRVPMVSVIMIFEITQNYTIIVPLMISNLISFFVSYRLQRVPIYEALALQEGIHLPTSESAKRHLQVRLAMRPPHESFTMDMTLTECLDRAGPQQSAGLAGLGQERSLGRRFARSARDGCRRGSGREQSGVPSRRSQVSSSARGSLTRSGSRAYGLVWRRSASRREPGERAPDGRGLHPTRRIACLRCARLAPGSVARMTLLLK